VNRLPSSAPQDLETAAFADGPRVIGLGNGDTFGPEYAHGVRLQIERVVEEIVYAYRSTSRQLVLRRRLAAVSATTARQHAQNRAAITVRPAEEAENAPVRALAPAVLAVRSGLSGVKIQHTIRRQGNAPRSGGKSCFSTNPSGIRPNT
jgi:hypothetical protein